MYLRSLISFLFRLVLTFSKPLSIVRLPSPLPHYLAHCLSFYHNYQPQITRRHQTALALAFGKLLSSVRPALDCFVEFMHTYAISSALSLKAVLVFFSRTGMLEL